MLIDLIRSPETVKKMTTNLDENLVKVREEQVKQQIWKVKKMIQERDQKSK
jgi:hypothetical protein